jgi:N-acetylmuramoyl-L-alanine amidase
MTRENDETLYDDSTPTTKQEDMKKRVALMNDAGCILAVSIHQNSFTEEKYQGAQVFYYTGSEESHRLATSIQRALVSWQDTTNTGIEKANNEYYLLRKTTVPTVICECGFLSNNDEAQLLVSDDYQEKTAWAISVGIIQYLNSEDTNEN